MDGAGGGGIGSLGTIGGDLEELHPIFLNEHKVILTAVVNYKETL